MGDAAGVSVCIAVGVAVDVAVGIAVGLPVAPRLAVVCRGCLPWRLPWRLPWALPWRLPWRLPWLVPWASTGFRDMPRHSVEAHGMPMEARGVSAVARGVAAEYVEIAMECCGGPWALPQCSAEKTVLYIRGAEHNKVGERSRRSTKSSFSLRYTGTNNMIKVQLRTDGRVT